MASRFSAEVMMFEFFARHLWPYFRPLVKRLNLIESGRSSPLVTNNELIPVIGQVSVLRYSADSELT